MNKVLIVIDMQNDFLTGSLANYDADRVTANVRNKILNDKWDKVFFTMDTHKPDYLKTSEGNYLPVEHCIHGTEGWKISKPVFQAANIGLCDTKIIEKETFGSTKLAKEVEMCIRGFKDEDTEITLVGVCTDICVISNALILKENNFIRENCRIVCDASCCSGVTKQKHDSAIEVMKSCQIEVINE